MKRLFLLLSLVVIVMVIFIYKFHNDEKLETNKKLIELQTQINDLDTTLNDLQNKVINTSEIINSNNLTENVTTQNNLSQIITNNEATYNISTRDEIYATITAIKDGVEFSREFEMPAIILDTGTMDIKEIGEVALVSYSGGEACVVNVYQLINNEIMLLGTIDCGADMVTDANYAVDLKNNTTVIINAKINDKTITNEFEMATTISNTNIIDIFNYGRVVLITECYGEYYKIHIYRLTQDYISGEIQEIKYVGSLE